MSRELKAMRDVMIEGIHRKMKQDERILFMAADFGSPQLDKLRSEFPDRFLNVGIAEQNLVNLAAGAALEGFTVYAYALAPFLTMRAFEQIRNNLALLSHGREVNVNLIGVGAGLSYDVSGPTHHCLEDLSVIRTLPGIEVISPSDWRLVEKLVDHSVAVKKPKYFRFDGKPLPPLAAEVDDQTIKQGFRVLKKGQDLCLVATGYLTHQALAAAAKLAGAGREIGVIDLFMFRPFDRAALRQSLRGYKNIITIEEAFIGKGGLDSLIAGVLREDKGGTHLDSIGFDDEYVFEVGDRASLLARL